MSTLGRRLSALEQLAEDAQRRETRTLLAGMPEAFDLTPAELEDAVSEVIACQERSFAWRREGLSEREIIRRQADAMGVDTQELVAEWDRTSRLV